MPSSADHSKIGPTISHQDQVSLSPDTVRSCSALIVVADATVVDVAYSDVEAAIDSDGTPEVVAALIGGPG